MSDRFSGDVHQRGYLRKARLYTDLWVTVAGVLIWYSTNNPAQLSLAVHAWVSTRTGDEEASLHGTDLGLRKIFLFRF